MPGSGTKTRPSLLIARPRGIAVRSPTRYRALSQECLEMANSAKYPERRAGWLALSAAWLSLVDRPWRPPQLPTAPERKGRDTAPHSEREQLTTPLAA